MTNFDVSEGLDLIGEGFFAKQVYRLLADEKELDQDGEQILNQAFHFLKDIQEGHRQVTSGDLGENAVRSVEAYNRAMISLSIQGEPKDIEGYVKEMLMEIDKTKKLGKIVPEKVKNTSDFFAQVRKAIIRETGRYMVSERDLVTWKLAPTLLHSSESL